MKRAARRRRLEFYGQPLPGVSESDLQGTLIVVEGPDCSGRSTQVILLTEWLESLGFAVRTTGLRRSNLVGRDIDNILAQTTVTPLTLALMYATDFFDQLENLILPALRAGMVVLADRWIFSLIARAQVRGIESDYLRGIYQSTLRPDLTFWMDVPPRVAFERQIRRHQEISYWESGRDMYLSRDLYTSFLKYQGMIRHAFEGILPGQEVTRLDGGRPVPENHRILRRHIARLLKIRKTSYKPSPALLPLWRGRGPV